MDHLFRRRFAKGKPITAAQVEPKEAESFSNADPRASSTMAATKEQEQAGGAETGSIPGTSSPGLARKPRARADRVISGGLCKARRTTPRFLPKSVPLSAAPEQKKDKKEGGKGGEEEQKERGEIEG
ncbi:hypothetical protein V2G26_019376 [Clonostachys chloroleuca]